MLTLEKAIIFATTAHTGQKDRAGLPYILHPLHVMSEMDTDMERIVAVLHDVTEDSECCLEDITKDLGLTEEMHIALFNLDKNNFNSYTSMIEAIKLNPISKKVKLADLEHNMDIRRVLGRADMSEKDRHRIAKYFRAWSFLKGE